MITRRTRKRCRKALDDGQEGLHVGRVPRPQFTAQRPAMDIQHQAHDHLGQVRAVVFALAVLAQFLTARAFEINRGGIEKDQINRAEEVPAPLEQFLFHPIFGAAGRV